ncbi:PspC domain-containing protein [Ligilactobacillus saerimneri]|uniref:Stress-responsive transcriptional regulator PspC n=1 Tax=Ligilactobacillus saerimneri 30a TaxID=1227363 RepID=M5J6L5_9LACO|nr:PspC domain-containing protein [Ligilactobacillus saerimneri]EKW98872.1 stress-responsive transcriptional regulator PspC [Ligilactobacillus saerimneri 30a]
MAKKQLVKSRDKIVAGVLGGVAEYLGWDKTIVRIIGGVLILTTGFGLLAYIIAAIVMPNAPRKKYDSVIEGEFTERP